MAAVSPRPSVVTFYSYKGGVGRTLLAVNVAVALARRGKTLLWDLDVEAPSMHCIRALRAPGKVRSGFLEWLVSWQRDQAARSSKRHDRPTKAALKRIAGCLRPTPIESLHLLAAHGDEANPAILYQDVDWSYWFQENPGECLRLFEALLTHWHELGFRHVVIDSRTGLTDLGALLVGLLPDASVLVGGYGAQNLSGLAFMWEALKRDTPEQKQMRNGRAAPELLLVASPIPQERPDLLSIGKKLWVDTFGLEPHSALEIPYDDELPFTEKLLINERQRKTGKAYEAVAATLIERFDRIDAEASAHTQTREERPDIFETLDVAGVRTPATVAATPEQTFEQQVSDLLRLLGYRVDVRQLAADGPPDLVATVRVGVDEVTYLVECKNTTRGVSMNVLERLSARLEDPALIDLGARGMVVAPSGFSPQAMDYAKRKRIRAITPEELEQQLVDFEPYLSRLIKNFEQSSLFRAYVTQRAAPTGAVKERGNVAIEDLVAHGLKWARGEGQRLWVLLGDYGTGKTAFTDKLAYELAINARKDRREPIPFTVNLRFVPNKATLEDVLIEQWYRDTGERKDPKLFIHLLRRGRLLLLFDSFDEMGIATAGRSVVDQFRMLVGVTARPGLGPRANRVLVTCREQFFKEHGEAQKAAREAEAPMSALRGVALRLDGAIDNLELFTQAQVAEYLNKRLGETGAAEAIRFMKRHGLDQLGDRPQLLDLIIKSLPKLQEQSSDLTLNPGRLYQAYTDQWLDDFKPVERQATSDQLRSVLEFLAGVLWARVGNRLHYGDLYALIKLRPDLCAGLDPNQLDVELRTAAFLSRTPDGLYGFSHKSFLEFFLARHIIRGGTHSDSSLLATALEVPRLSSEICSFIDDLVGHAEDVRDQFARSMQRVLSLVGEDQPPLTSRINALLLGYSLAKRENSRSETAGATSLDRHPEFTRYLPRGAQLEGADLSEFYLVGAYLQDANLRGAKLIDALLENADLSGACLDSARLASCRLVNASVANASMLDADAWRSDAVGLDLTGARAHRSSWCGASLERSKLEGCDFFEADLRGARFSGSTGAPTLEGALLHGATARNADRSWPEELRHPPLTALTVRVAPQGNIERLQAAHFSPDGDSLVTVGIDSRVMIWDVSSGEIRANANPTSAAINHASFTIDGTSLLLGFLDGTVMVRRIDRATPDEICHTLSSPLVGMRASRDNRVAALLIGNGQFRILESESKTVRSEFQCGTHDPTDFALAPDGSLLAVVQAGGALGLWSTITGEQLLLPERPEEKFFCVALGPDNDTIAAAHSTSEVSIISAAGKALVGTLQSNGQRVRCLAFSPDGRFLAAGTNRGHLLLFEVPSGTLVRDYKGGPEWIRSVEFAPDGKLMVAAGMDGLAWWSVSTGEARRPRKGLTGWHAALAMNPQGTLVASSNGDGRLAIWNASSGRLDERFNRHAGWCRALAWNQDGRLLAAGDMEDDISVWDVGSRTVRNSIKAQGAHMTWAAAFSPDGRILAAGSRRGVLKLWNASTGALHREFKTEPEWIWSIAFSIDGLQIACASLEGKVSVWDVKSGEHRIVLENSDGMSRCVSFTPDGKYLVSASVGVFRRWDIATWKDVSQPLDVPTAVMHFDLSRDGRLLGTAEVSGTARIFDATTSGLLRELRGHEGAVTGISFGLETGVVATSGEDARVILWDVSSGRKLWFGTASQAGWAGADMRTDPRGLWRGRGAVLAEIVYENSDESVQPAPWIPRRWRAADLPDLEDPKGMSAGLHLEED